MRPLIGITTSLNEGEQRLDLAYVHAVSLAGGTPIIVPMSSDPEGTALELASLLDGLVITGGPAIVDGLQTDQDVATLPADIDLTHPMRTRSDSAMLSHVLDAGKPVLGICYGMQLLNAFFGGTIYADVQRQRENTRPHSPKRGGSTHDIRHASDSMMAQLLGERIEVNTRHIQAIAEVGSGLRATGHAPDGVIEAFEGNGGRLLGVQYHPERLGETGAPLFHHLVELARV